MIEVQNISKRFGSKRAVDDLSFTVQKGEVLGFLGPNGAGKSTTMRMITGYLPPSSGVALIDGVDVSDRPIEVKRKLGYLPENAPLYSDMTVAGFLKFIAELRGLRGARRREAIDRVVELCFLAPVYHQSVDTLSKGYRHRTCFAQSILHDPEVLILDEPTDGLDPNQKHEVRQLIRKMGQEKAIIFSTHILEEVEAACSRAIIIDRGKMVANGTPAELKAQAPAAGAIALSLIGASADDARSEISTIEWVAEVESSAAEEEGGTVSLQVTPVAEEEAQRELPGALFQKAVLRGWQVVELQRQEGQLDVLFRSLTFSDADTGAETSPEKTVSETETKSDSEASEEK